MGIIARQTIKSSTVGYIAALVGLVNTLFIYTLAFDEAGLGRFRYVQEMGIVLASFFSLGVSNVVVRFFPEFRDSTTKHHGFLGFIFVVLLSGVVLFLSLYGLTKQWWPTEFKNNFWYIFFLFVAIAFAHALYNYSSNFRLITVPIIIRQLWVKIGLGLSAISFLYFQISFDKVLGSVVMVYSLATIALIAFVIKKGNFSLRINTKHFTVERLKNMFVFAGFGILGSLGSSLANKLDIFMVTEMLNFTKTGVYSLALSISGLMILATGPLLGVAGPILAESIAKDDMNHVQEIYKKSSTNLFLLGSALMLLLWINIDAIFELIPNGENYTEGKIVILILGLAKLVDMVTSVNEVIIAYSKYFRFNLYALLFLGLLNIVANLTFIPYFDIAGAALATFLSVSLFNIVKTVYIYKKFRMHPFQLKLLYILLTVMGLYAGSLILPVIANPLLSIVYKTVIIGIAFVFVSLKYDFSKEATSIWTQLKFRLLAIFNK